MGGVADPGLAVFLKVDLAPVGQPRVKATSRGQRAGVYTPRTIGKGQTKRQHPYIALRAAIHKAAVAAWGSAKPFSGPVRVDWIGLFPRPQRLLRKSSHPGRIRHTVKPDRDNCEKLLLDALKGVAWEDDCQVCDGSPQKFYVAMGESPAVMMWITPLSEYV